MSRIPQIYVGLFGLGTVGGGVYTIMEKNRELISKKLGFPIQIKKICDPDPKKSKNFHVPSSALTTKPNDILDDPEISIIVELIGDKPVAREIMSSALNLGKHVVTANKAILAQHGPELYALASKNEVDILFEAAVAGSIPILRSIREGFIADSIKSIQGIINGTANFILTEMSEKKRDFSAVLLDAQKAGFAESNPASDIEGHDTAHKLSILSTMAYGAIVPVDKVYTEGITNITAFDFEMAERFGYSIKLLAISKKINDEIEARVHPTMIPKEQMLASVRGAYNAILVNGEYIGQSMQYGLGAGSLPTATAVVADIVEIARNIALRVRGVPPMGYRIEEMPKAKIRSMEDIESSYYLRFTTQDKPGVFAKIANALGQNHVSISSVYQHGREEDKEIPIVVVTHLSKEKNMMMALKEIDRLSVITQKTTVIRIES